MFEIPAGLLSWFYGWTNSYIVAIALIAAVVMAITTPLTLKSTKGMLEMQRLAPEMRKLQNEYRNDRQKLNEEMMKLYQEHKVNPLASCLPIAAQMPIFIIMFRIMRALTYKPRGDAEPIARAVLGAFGRDTTELGFVPRFLSTDSSLFQSLFGRTEMPSAGIDLSRSAFDAIQDGIGDGVVYAVLVVGLGALYFGQQKMVAARAAMSPTMSPAQQKLMQYLPVFFAVFQIFFLAALVVYYIFQTLFRIVQQAYITRAFYGHEESLGRQAQRASEAAREASKQAGEKQGLFAQARRDLTSARGDEPDSATTKKHPGARNIASKRVTPPKSRPEPSGRGAKGRPQTARGGGKGRPTPTRKQAQERKQTQAKRSAKSGRPKSSGKKRR